MRIAIIGTRGIPANYGGFETFAEELSTRLVERGHEVTVYGRSNNITYSGDAYRGVKLTILPTVGTKHLDTVAHTCLSVLHALPRRFDAVLMCNAANAIFAIVPRLTGTPVALNVDGIERNRKKWGLAARTYYRISEWLSTFIPSAVVTDAACIRDYYRETYNKDSILISYGADCGRTETTGTLDRLGVNPRRYLLYVSRLEPENNAQLVVQAYEKVETDLPLLIVGDAPYNRKYIDRLKSTSDRRILFPGAIYGTGYRELQSHAYAYIHATEVGGTHPALVESMGSGNCVLVYDTVENREVVADCGLFFDGVESLQRQIRFAIENPSPIEEFRRKAAARARAQYSWDSITDSYEQLLRSLVAGENR